MQGARTHRLGESRKGMRRCCLIRAEFKKPWQKDWRGKGGTPTKWKSAEGPSGKGSGLGQGTAGGDHTR